MLLLSLLSSSASTHSVAPFFSLLRKGSLHFTASSGTNSYWTNMKFRSLSEEVLLFNLAFEIAWNSLRNKRYGILKFGLFSSAKFTRKMSLKLFIAVSSIQFSFELYS